MSLKKTNTPSASSRQPRSEVRSSTPAYATGVPPIANASAIYDDPVPPGALESDGVDLHIVYDSYQHGTAHFPTTRHKSQRNSKRQIELRGEFSGHQPSKKSKQSKPPNSSTKSSKTSLPSVTNDSTPVLIEVEDEISSQPPSKKSRLSKSSKSSTKESLSSDDSLLIPSELHQIEEDEVERRANYESMVALTYASLIPNVEKLECPICFSDVDVGEGATLQECLHSFCKDCLARTIQFSEAAVIRCPFQNNEYSCESYLQEREIRSLVTPDMYEKYLQRSLTLAESQAQNSFHCKTVDCPGWCLFENAVNLFMCPVCQHTNCLTCAAIHEGRNCRQYQDDLVFLSDSNEEAKKTKNFLENELKKGKAMRCPMCAIIIVKRGGCDGLRCSMCGTDICWRTKGPRWGPKGPGDKSGGCKCMVKDVPCHPRCRGCH